MRGVPRPRFARRPAAGRWVTASRAACSAGASGCELLVVLLLADVEVGASRRRGGTRRSVSPSVLPGERSQRALAMLVTPPQERRRPRTRGASDVVLCQAQALLMIEPP